MSVEYLDGFREGCYARDLHHETEAANDAVSQARVWLTLCVAVAVVATFLALWITAAVWGVGAAFWAYALHASRKRARRADARLAEWKTRVREWFQ